MNAARLLRSAKAAAAIVKLRAAASARALTNLDSIIAELVEARERALEDRNQAAAIIASVQKAKMLGHQVEKQQLDATTLTPKPCPFPTKRIELSIEEWQVQ